MWNILFNKRYASRISSEYINSNFARFYLSFWNIAIFYHILCLKRCCVESFECQMEIASTIVALLGKYSSTREFWSLVTWTMALRQINVNFLRIELKDRPFYYQLKRVDIAFNNNRNFGINSPNSIFPLRLQKFIRPHHSPVTEEKCFH